MRRRGDRRLRPPSIFIVTLFLLVGRGATSVIESNSRPHDLHFVRHVHDVYQPPARGAYVYSLKLLNDTPRAAPLLQWAMSSILSLNDTAPVYDIVVLLDAPADDGLDRQLRAVGATHVYRVQQLVQRLPGNVAVLYDQLLQQRNHHGHYPGAIVWWHYGDTPPITRTGTWTKLLVWSMTEYDKVVSLDADITAYANADDLLAYPELSAVPELLFPIVAKEHLLLFNAGMLVLQPSMV